MAVELDELQSLRQLIEDKLDWGRAADWQSADFERLQQRVLDETGVSLSVSTLRRIWGRARYGHLPSPTTLNTLAQFAGYEHWRAFLRSRAPVSGSSNALEVDPALTHRSPKAWVLHNRIALFGLGLALLLTGVVVVHQRKSPTTGQAYSFRAKRVSRDIPNSVIFSYQASAATDSVYIQQSWDARRRTSVNKMDTTHTAIYYEPGFFKAKLVVGRQIVRQQALLIPTKDWLGMVIPDGPVPVYLQPDEFLSQAGIRLSPAVIRAKNLGLEPYVPMVKFYNVGNFTPVPLNDFSFSAKLKNEFQPGAPCQRSWVALITNDTPIIIPLSRRGCVSDLQLMSINGLISGKTTDLSRFGVDNTDWVKVTCRGQRRRLYYYLNEKIVYEERLPRKNTLIVGMAYFFEGAGAVQEIRLGRLSNFPAFQAFSH